jgi:hypothetical protein
MGIGRSLRFLSVAAVLSLCLSVGCGEAIEPGDLTEETHILESEGAKRVSADIEMSFGKIRLEGGSRDLIDAEFIYNIKDWKPVVEYEVDDGLGELILRQPETKGKSFGRGVRNEWHLRFGDDVPLDVEMKVGAAECTMDLQGLPFTGLDFTFGAGDVDIVIGGSRTLEDLTLEAGAGDITIDLRGDWDVDLDARIEAGVGRVAIDLPEDAGVRVETSKGIGKVSLSGLRRKGDYYVNDAYGKSGADLDIEVKTGVGAIELRVGGRVEEGVTI